VRDEDIDRILKQSADAAPPVDPAILERVSESIRSSLEPVRPLPPSWVLTGVLILICAAMALAGGILLGPHGVRKMTHLQVALIFPVLGIFVCIGAMLCVSEAIPGSRRPIAPWLLAATACAALAALFGLLFPEYRTEHFVSRGIACLVAGLGLALPASLAVWWSLRRGFAVSPVTAALARGTLAGLAGLAMLEIHCPILEASHVMLWHVAVLAVASAAEMLLARIARAYRR
jgi:hypothetical protein